MKFSESKLAFYIVTCAAVYLELFTSWGFLSRISFLALFVLLRFFFGDALALRKSYSFVKRLFNVSCSSLIELMSLKLDV